MTETPEAYHTRAELVIGLDDTDCPEQGGTGRIARTIAARLRERFPVWGVSRHQFIVLPEIRYTRNNSGNAIHLLALPEDLEGLTAELEGWVRELSLPGSDPGLCLARPESVRSLGFGRAAQSRFVSREEARSTADAAEVILRNPCPTDDGIVGALAAACLGAQGHDGRFVEVGGLRDLAGSLTAQQVLAAGGDEVVDAEGDPVTEGVIAADRLRPALRRGKCVLYCVRRDDGAWAPVVGAPGDREKEGRADAGQ